MARIIVSENGVLTHISYNLRENISIGRSNDNSVTLEDDSISAHHAMISLEQDEKGRIVYVLEDLGSRSGIYINKSRVERTPLKHKDVIRIGRQQFTFFNYKDLISTLNDESITR